MTNKNEVTLFNYEEHQVRVVHIDGNPWFLGSDLLRVLFGKASGLGNTYSRLASNERTKVKRIHLGLPPGKDVELVTESGLYKLMLRSDKDTGRKFQDWVTREVLPSIRKNGGYVLGQEKVVTGEMHPMELAMRGYEALKNIVDSWSVSRAASCGSSCITLLLPNYSRCGSDPVCLILGPGTELIVDVNGGNSKLFRCLRHAIRPKRVPPGVGGQPIAFFSGNLERELTDDISRVSS